MFALNFSSPSTLILLNLFWNMNWIFIPTYFWPRPQFKGVATWIRQLTHFFLLVTPHWSIIVIIKYRFCVSPNLLLPGPLQGYCYLPWFFNWSYNIHILWFKSKSQQRVACSNYSHTVAKCLAFHVPVLSKNTNEKEIVLHKMRINFYNYLIKK